MKTFSSSAAWKKKKLAPQWRHNDMLIIEHRINTVKSLKSVPPEHGVEVDIRYDNRAGRLYLSHDLGGGEDFEEYLRNFHHAFIVLDIKEVGIEKQCAELALQYGVPPEKYFFLDVEFPFIYFATRNTGVSGFKTSKIAVRYSEAEPLEMALAQKGFVDWAWIDTNTILPLDERAASALSKNFKTCLVSPDRWRPERAHEEIPAYRKKMIQLGFRLDAVMVGKEFVDLWK